MTASLEHPALTDCATWIRLSSAERLGLLELIASRSGREATARIIEPEPRRLMSGGPRVIHRRTGLRFCFIPGGRHLIGPRRERRAVELRPFLLAESPLDPGDALRLSGLRWSPLRTAIPSDVAPLYVLPDELGKLLEGPLRLPSDDEWEAAYRAATLSTYFWGEAQPKAPPALPHPLGLSMMGFFDELTTDAETPDDLTRHRVRGGAARLWPWLDGGHEWLWLMSAASRPWALEGEPRDVAIRPAISI